MACDCHSLPVAFNSVPNLRSAKILHEAGFSPPQQIPSLTKLPPFAAVSPSDHDNARLLLNQQRMIKPNFQQKFRTLWSKTSEEARGNTNNGTFTVHEIAKAFDTLLSRTSLSDPGIALALLSLASDASVTSLHELWSHLHEPKSKEMTARLLDKSKNISSMALSSSPLYYSILSKKAPSMLLRSRSSVVLKATPIVDQNITWLDIACRENNPEYIQLMCQFEGGLDKRILDRGLIISVSNHGKGTASLKAVQVLLSYGAVTSAACQDAIRECFKRNDVALMKLLLSTPNAMSAEVWRYCLEVEHPSTYATWSQWPELLLACVAHRQDIVCKHLLHKSLEAQNVRTTAVILAYESVLAEDFYDICESACRLVSSVLDRGIKHTLFKILAESGYIADNEDLRGELLEAVKSRQLPMIKVFVDSGVTVDNDPPNALHWAVSNMDFDVLALLQKAQFTSPILPILDLIPSTASEYDNVKLVRMLGKQRLHGQPLDLYLIRAVLQEYFWLVEELLNFGASIEFEQASAVQLALMTGEIEILLLLLRNNCSAELLSKHIPIAMALKPRSLRLEAMTGLLEKGVLPQKLGVPLQNLLDEDPEVDAELVQLLLQYKAPIYGIEGENKNVITTATRKGNLPILRMLCNAGPRNETLAQAIPVAFSSIATIGYEVSLEIIKLLLTKGATGIPLDKTLIDAISQDRPELVTLLLRYRANANTGHGYPFRCGIMAKNLDLLQTLCEFYKPTQQTIQSVLFDAIDPHNYMPGILELLLSSAQPPDAAAALNASWSFKKLKGHPQIDEIILCLLRHGLDVNLNGGELLSFAIGKENPVLLRKMLSANPSILSLTTAFHTASAMDKLSVMESLLIKAKSAEIGQSEALETQMEYAFEGKPAGLRLCRQHNAVVSESTFTKACRYIAAAPPDKFLDQNRAIFDMLMSGLPSSEILLDILSRTLFTLFILIQHSAKTPSLFTAAELLLANGAAVKIEIIKVALRTSSVEVLDLLILNIRDAETVVTTYKYCRQFEMDFDKRYRIYRALLERSPRAVPTDIISDSLVESIQLDDPGELVLSKMLLKLGASPVHCNGEPLRQALRANSFVLVRILIQFIDDDRMADIAFDIICETPMLKKKIREELYRSLLAWNINKKSLSRALSDSFKDGFPESSFLELLLAKGADPCLDGGHCFAVAAKRGATAKFRALCKSRFAKLQVLLSMLMNNFQEEDDIVNWLQVYVLEQPPHGLSAARLESTKEWKGDLLFECMRKFPDGKILLKFLLDQGVSASAKTEYCLCPGWKLESCTALIWALSAQPRIENDPILVLLSQGHAAHPTYVTPLTKVSAAFLCLLDKTRTPVLRALLKLDKDRITDYQIPESSFISLATYPEQVQNGSASSDADSTFSLSAASVRLGNFKAFILLADEIVPNDGTLHTAAFLALPRFVKWLLSQNHDPDHPGEYFGNLVPLACVCASKEEPTCKIANQEVEWRIRQMQTMLLLAAETSPKFRVRNMTVLHYAMEQGYETAKAMIEVLDISHDPKQDEKYLYVDREGEKYTLKEYVLKLWDGNEREKEHLISCMKPDLFRMSGAVPKLPSETVHPSALCGRLG